MTAYCFKFVLGGVLLLPVCLSGGRASSSPNLLQPKEFLSGRLVANIGVSQQQHPRHHHINGAIAEPQMDEAEGDVA